MLDEEGARRAALGSPVFIRAEARPGAARELRNGWYFPPVYEGDPKIGCNGVIVNKETGGLFHVGSAFPVNRDIALYDQGYQFDRYDLTIVAVRDRNQTLQTLRKLRLQKVESTEEHGLGWKIPRDLTAREVSTRLDVLPCVFQNVSLYFEVEELECAREARWFTFEVREHVSGDAR